MIVELDPEEILHAGMIGVMRRVSSLRRGGTPAYEQESVDRWTAEVEGACAELAVAKATGSFWQAIVSRPVTGGPDVGDLHVRHTTRDHGCLIIRPADPIGLYVLVTGRAPTLTIRGYGDAADVRLPKYLRRGNGLPPAWFVPQSELYDLADYLRLR